MTDVLVTGGAGFIGSHLVDKLMVRGDRVTVLDNLSTGQISNIQHHMGGTRFRFIMGSILDSETLEPLIREAGQIFHLAAAVGVQHVLNDPMGAMITNIRGTENVLDLACKYWVRTVIASSSEVYGKLTGTLKEDGDRLLGPTISPRWSYSASKAIDEYIALSYAGQGLPVSIVRYFNIYGPRLDPNGYGSVIAKFMTQALRGENLSVYEPGTQTRCFTYVKDAVRGTILAGHEPRAAGKAFNIGATQPVSIEQLANMVRSLAGCLIGIDRVPYPDMLGPNFEEPQSRVPDMTRAQAVLGLNAGSFVPIEEGLKHTWKDRNQGASKGA